MTTRHFGKIKITQSGYFTFEERPTRWLVDDLWTASSTGVFSGPSKKGKTWTILDLCVSVAAGVPFLSKYPVQQGAVLLASPEGPTEELEKRIDMICARKNVPRQSLPLHIITCDSPLLIDSPADQELILKAVRDKQAALLVLDPFVRFFGGCESYADDVKRAANFLNELAAVTGASIMMTHHDSKSGESLRGSSVLLSFGDNYWFLKVDAADNRRLEFILKHGESPAPVPVRMDSIGGNACMIVTSAPAKVEKKDFAAELLGWFREKYPNSASIRAARTALGGDFQKYTSAMRILIMAGEINKLKKGAYKARGR